MLPTVSARPQRVIHFVDYSELCIEGFLTVTRDKIEHGLCPGEHPIQTSRPSAGQSSCLSLAFGTWLRSSWRDLIFEAFDLDGFVGRALALRAGDQVQACPERGFLNFQCKASKEQCSILIESVAAVSRRNCSVCGFISRRALTYGPGQFR